MVDPPELSQRTPRSRCVAILHAEHRRVRQALDVLMRQIRDVEQGVIPPEKELDAVIVFFRRCVEACHEAKEEKFLFPALEAKGVATGMLGVLRVEHDMGKALIQSLARMSQGFGHLPGARRTFLDDARSFYEFFIKHVQKEEHILLPIADQLIDDELDARIVAGFEAHDLGVLGSEDQDKLWQAVEIYL